MDTNLPVRSSGFASILWPPDAAAGTCENVDLPECFHDLNLDQVEAAVVAAFAVEKLTPFFRVPLASIAAVAYRQAIFQDLERAELRVAFDAFAAALREVNAMLAGLDKLFYPRERQRARLAAAARYCDELRTLHRKLDELPHASPGLGAFAEYLTAYHASTAFTGLATDVGRIRAALDGIHFELLVRTGTVTVRPFDEEPDASAEVLRTFARFRTDLAAPDRAGGLHRAGIRGLNHIEAQILHKVALLFPEPFAALDAFCDRHGAFIESAIARCAREVCFYLTWLHYITPLRASGLRFCYPTVSQESRAIAARDAFDVALAAQRQTVIPNGFALAGAERIIVVSGPNNGGKTTFARMVAQLAWLAALGCPVPGSEVRTYLFDHLYTHFERQEDATSQRGKLQDDLIRIHAILARATPRSLVVLNEIFSSTTLEDAIWLGRKIMARLSALDAITVCVTFLDELATFDAKTVSMVAGVDPADPAIRTFRIERRPPDGLAYALAVARKYRVTREELLARIRP